MITPEWPISTVRVAPLLNTFQEKPESNRVTFQPAKGAVPKVRRRFTSSIWRVSWQRIFGSSEELDLFWDFYEDTLKNGSLKFLMRHPIRGTTHTWRFAPEAEPSMSEQDGNYILSIELLRLD